MAEANGQGASPDTQMAQAQARLTAYQQQHAPPGAAGEVPDLAVAEELNALGSQGGPEEASSHEFIPTIDVSESRRGGGSGGIRVPAAEASAMPVQLAVYDISHGWASRLSRLLFCTYIPVAPHTSILIFGKEYFWGGSVQKCLHEDFKQQTGTEPTEYVDLGYTSIPEELFNDFLTTVGPRFTPETYHIMENNCNNFSEECSQVCPIIHSFIIHSFTPRYRSI